MVHPGADHFQKKIIFVSMEFALALFIFAYILIEFVLIPSDFDD